MKAHQKSLAETISAIVFTELYWLVELKGTMVYHPENDKKACFYID